MDKLSILVGVETISCSELRRFHRLKAIVCDEEMVRVGRADEKPKGQGVKGLRSQYPISIGMVSKGRYIM
jgi:hypothetical protein